MKRTIVLALLSLFLSFSIARADKSIIAPEQSTIAVLDKMPETEALMKNKSFVTVEELN